MKVINASYEILTDISPYATCELEQIERIARTCYKSEDKIKDQGESAKELIARLIANGHEAMLEHSQLSVKFICDRGVSHELVRHRMASFAQESTRYCNYSKDKFGNELTFIRPYYYFDNNRRVEQAVWDHMMQEVEDAYISLIQNGSTPQEARCILPNSLKTEVVVTANYREWRHILELRCDKAAHPQMRELMIPLLEELHGLIPIVFDDIYEAYFPLNESKEE